MEQRKLVKPSGDDLIFLLESVTQTLALNVEVDNIQSTIFNIPRQSRLDRAFITSIATYKTNDVSHTIDGKVNVTDAAFAKSFITIQDNNSYNIIDEIPLISLAKTEQAGEKTLLNFSIINWENSKITVADTADNVANSAYIIEVQYIRTDYLQKMGISIDWFLQKFAS